MMFKQAIGRLEIFAGLQPSQITEISDMVELVCLPAKMVIFEQNTPANFLYILSQGEVSVRYKPYDGPQLTIARIQPGGVFGWSAVLQRELYTSGAVAEENSEAYRISSAALHALCEKAPDTGVILLNRLAGVIATRLKSTHSQVFQMLVEGVHVAAITERVKEGRNV